MGTALEKYQILVKLNLAGFDLSITTAVLVLWAAVLLVFVFAFWATRRMNLAPGRGQSLIEVIYEFWESQTADLLRDQTKTWLPFIFAVFCFVLACNLLGMIPNVYPITANINVTVALSLLVFILYNVAGIKRQGMLRYLKEMIPPGVPLYLAPFMVALELLGHLARPFSLAVRLFANMTAGHVIAFTILSLIFVFKNIWLAGFPLLGRAAIGLFEVFIAFIQAYVFAFLSAMYIGLAISEEH